MTGCCERRTDGASRGSDQSRVLVEYDFRTPAPVAIVNGPQTVAGYPFVGVNVASAAVFQTSPTGLRIAQLAATAAVLTTVSQTAPYLYTELEDVPNWDAGMNLILEAYIAAYTAGPASVSDRCQVGLFKLQADPIAGTGSAAAGFFGGFRRSATAGNLKCLFRATDSSAGTALDANLVGLFNSFALHVSMTAFISAGIGNYAAGVWPRFSYAMVDTQGNAPASTPATRLLIAATFASSAAPTLDFTIERMRVRAA